MKAYYEDDLITLYNADFREVLPTLPDSSVDMVWADPPYGHNQNDGDLAHQREAALGQLPTGPSAPEGRPILNDGPEANDLVQEMFAESARLLRPGCCCCCCGGGGGPDPQFARWALWLDAAIPFKHAVVWDKGGLGMGWHYRRNYELVLIGQKSGAACHWFGGNDVANVIRISGIKPKADDHPTPKPESLVQRFVDLHTAPGDLIVDPFCGGGPLLTVAKRSGRRAIGVELDERWCELAAKRLAQGAFDLFGTAA
jgi:site-specific DNA-methyltransferase (adenine-specific)